MFRLVGTSDDAGSVPSGSRLAAWNYVVGGLFDGMAVDAPEGLDARWSSCTLGDVRLSAVSSSQATVRRWFDRPPVDDGYGKVHLQKRGTSLTTQKEAQTLLSAGDITFCASDRPYTIQLSDRNLMYVVEFPRAAIGEDAFTPGRLLPHDSPVAGVLNDFLDSLLRQSWPDSLDVEEGKALGDIILSLLRRSASDMPASGRHMDLIRQIMAFIDANIFESSLRTRTIADAFSLSTRAVLALFAELSTTPTLYIIGRRLALAADRLTAGGEAASLSDIAYEFGFSDASHFSRHFKRHYRMTPGAYARMTRSRN